MADRHDRQYVAERVEQSSRQQRQGIGALWSFDFPGQGRGIIPAHEIPHVDDDRAD
jgi:hypothetical protein